MHVIHGSGEVLVQMEPEQGYPRLGTLDEALLSKSAFNSVIGDILSRLKHDRFRKYVGEEPEMDPLKFAKAEAFEVMDLGWSDDHLPARINVTALDIVLQGSQRIVDQIHASVYVPRTDENTRRALREPVEISPQYSVTGLQYLAFNVRARQVHREIEKLCPATPALTLPNLAAKPTTWAA